MKLKLLRKALFTLSLFGERNSRIRVSLLRSILLKSAKILITLLLLIWILHVIFMEQGAKAALQMGSNWEELTRWEQWGIAWFYGPPVLWEVFRTISPWGFLFSPRQFSLFVTAVYLPRLSAYKRSLRPALSARLFFRAYRYKSCL